MHLSARVAKLERSQQRILRCYWCRFALHSTIPTTKPHLIDGSDRLPTKCWFCGTAFSVPLRGLNGHQREAIELIYNSHPTKQFIDERIHAAHIWFSLSLSGSEVQRYTKDKQLTDLKSTNPESRNHESGYGSNSGIEAKAKRARQDLEERAKRFREVQMERFKKRANGPDSFPLDEVLEIIKGEYPTSGYDKSIDDLIVSLRLEKYSTTTTRLRSNLAVCNLHLRVCKAREACEIVLWKQPMNDTTEEINFFRQEKQKAIAGACESVKA
ncbi:MAG TPA: hypothetical protein VN643_23210 [Pyrinomonadaceae bacterium]|nr:hypothetical protein [Pyrinomonadaceae bacterium]